MRWSALAACVSLSLGAPAFGQSARDLADSTLTAQKLSQRRIAQEKEANTTDLPRQILRTGIDLCETGLAANTLQLSDSIGLTPILREMNELREKAARGGEGPSLEKLDARQNLSDATLKAALLIQKTNLDIDFVLAEISAEQETYSEMLATYIDDRDKKLTRTNAMSFISNGALWAICEGLAIPTYKNARYAIPSGITGILAGIVPSAASMYTLKQVSGKKEQSENDPNMLAKVFDYPTTPDIEYPQSVWEFLNQVPAGSPQARTRREQLVDAWIADANINAFTDRKSKTQLDIITASSSHRKGLSIDTLTARKVMLQKLAAEVMKMKRMLLELSMVLLSEKQFMAYEDTKPKHISTNDGGDVH